MAEIAASIIGISSFGVQLALTLYDFGANTASAKQQTNRIAKHITMYANVLELLGDRLEEDAPIVSEAAIDLVEELYESSEELFSRVQALLPRREPNDDLSFFQKIAWNFKKSKVALLVGELEYLKTTVQLLVTVIYAGKKLRSYKRRRREHDIESCGREREAVERQYLKAQTTIVEQVGAASALPNLQEEASAADALGIEAPVVENSHASTAIDISRMQASSLSSFQKSLMRIEDTAQRQSLALQHSRRLFQDLLLQWTKPGPDTEQQDFVVTDTLRTSGNSGDAPNHAKYDSQARFKPVESLPTQRVSTRYSSNSGEKTNINGDGLFRLPSTQMQQPQSFSYRPPQVHEEPRETSETMMKDTPSSDRFRVPTDAVHRKSAVPKTARSARVDKFDVSPGQDSSRSSMKQGGPAVAAGLAQAAIAGLYFRNKARMEAEQTAMEKEKEKEREERHKRRATRRQHSQYYTNDPYAGPQPDPYPDPSLHSYIEYGDVPLYRDGNPYTSI